MSQNNPHPPSQIDLMEIDALFKRIAERGRKIRSQAQENSVYKQNTEPPTGQAVTDEKVTQAQGSK